jgi:ferric-dicitrate binding protein FerR (iron transport regulator)
MKPQEVYSFEVLADFVAGRLTDDEAQAVRRYVDESPEGRRAVERLRHLHEAMMRSDDLVARDVSEADHRRLMEEVARVAVRTRGSQAEAAPSILHGLFGNRPAWKIAMTVAASVLIVVGAMVLEFKARSPVGAEMARAVAARGTVYVGGEPASLEPNTMLREGQTLRTGGDARLSLRLVTGAEIDLNQHTSLTLQATSERRTLCSVAEGQFYANVAKPVAKATPTTLVVNTPVGRIEATEAAFDLKVVPQSASARWRHGPRLTLLATEGVEVLGHVGPVADVRLTVVSGEVTFHPADDATMIVAAGSQLRYDPSRVTSDVREVEVRRYILWRLGDEDVFRLARRHLGDLFAAQMVTPLSGRRVRLDYDFLSSAELKNDWQCVGDLWRLHRNALRVRMTDGAEPKAAEIVSRATFIGEPEVRFDVTISPTRASSLGWAMRYAHRPDGSAPVAGAAQVSFDGQGKIDLRLDLAGTPSKTKSSPSPGPMFSFGGRLEEGQAYLLLGRVQEEPSPVLTETVPEATLRRLHHADSPEPVRVVISALGPDIFINRIVVIGRPDPNWLRASLASHFERLDRATRR